MKTNIIHSIVVCLTAFTLPFMVACSSQEESLPDNITEAALYLNIEPIAQTRAGVAELPDNEKMHSVRVIVLHEDGKVEHNRFYPLEGAQERKSIILKVKSGEKKRIYLFANEESVSAAGGVTGGKQTLAEFFESYKEGMLGFEDVVDNLYFAPDYTNGKPIPMSSMYEIKVPEKENYNGTFYVVRVATKFTINFMNWRSEEVKVNSISIAKYADKNFLMAHVNDTQQNQNLFKDMTWIEWLKKVSDASHEDSSPEATEKAGWLKDYELPEQANKEMTYIHSEAVTVSKPEIDLTYPTNSKPGGANQLPVFYLPESKNPKADAIDGEQEYIMTIRIDGREESFTRTLPNLKALFRNTHVAVNITLKVKDEIAVDVIPYSEVVLEPEFGLGDKPETEDPKPENP